MRSYRKKFRTNSLLLVVSLLFLLILSACSSGSENIAPQADSGTTSQQTNTTQEPVIVQAETVQKQAEPVQNPVEPVEDPSAQPAQEIPTSEQAESSLEPAAPAEPTSPATPTSVPAELPTVEVQAAAPQESVQLETKPEVGFLAPDFALTTLDGQTVRLGELRGRPVVINYWATWCVPCKAELPILQQLSQEYAASGLQVITINAIEQDSLDNIHTLLGELGLTMPVLLDQQNQFQASYNQLFFPTSYFIDQNGVLRWIKLGDASEALLRENMDKLINNQL